LAWRTTRAKSALRRTLFESPQFDRADAYVRVLETSDDETIQNVAKACIQAGTYRKTWTDLPTAITASLTKRFHYLPVVEGEYE